MIAIDTNVLLRYLLDDDESQSPKALALTKIDPPSAHKVDPPTVGAHSN
jgi:predicted nucleic-acid-binding protein